MTIFAPVTSAGRRPWAHPWYEVVASSFMPMLTINMGLKTPDILAVRGPKEGCPVTGPPTTPLMV